MKTFKSAAAALSMLAVFTSQEAVAGAFKLESAEISAGGEIAEKFAFSGFGCTGSNISPELEWSGAPEGTKSFALMVHDPDAKSGGAGFWHWVVVDIPVDASKLAEGSGDANASALPEGARQIATDFGVPGWGGPCPPEADGPHTYNFTLYALPVEKLEIGDDVTASFTGFVINSMALGSANLSAEYDR